MPTLIHVNELLEILAWLDNVLKGEPTLDVQIQEGGRLPLLYAVEVED